MVKKCFNKESIPCSKDIDCPPGMFCLVPDGICVTGPSTITCAGDYGAGVQLICYEFDENIFPPCKWTGKQADMCFWL